MEDGQPSPGCTCMGAKSEGTNQVVENAFVQLPLGRPALPQLVVVVVQTLPVGAELIQAVLVHILDPVLKLSVSHLLLSNTGCDGVSWNRLAFTEP